MVDTSPETKEIHPNALRDVARLEKYLLGVDELVDKKQVALDTKLQGILIVALTLAPTINCISKSDLISEVESKYYLLGKFYGPRRKCEYYYHAEREDELKHKWARSNLR